MIAGSAGIAAAVAGAAEAAGAAEVAAGTADAALTAAVGTFAPSCAGTAMGVAGVGVAADGTAGAASSASPTEGNAEGVTAALGNGGGSSLSLFLNKLQPPTNDENNNADAKRRLGRFMGSTFRMKAGRYYRSYRRCTNRCCFLVHLDGKPRRSGKSELHPVWCTSMIGLLVEDVTPLWSNGISVHVRFKGGVTKTFQLPTPNRGRIGTRRIHVAGITNQPREAWMK